MDYNIETLKSEIRMALDENAVGTQLITDEDIDTLDLEQIIESRIPIAARIVITLAPARMLGDGENIVGTGTTIGWYGTGTCVGGSIPLPSDFLRILTFKMDDWKKEVRRFITDTDPEYDLQFSEYAGLRGNQRNPVVAITHAGGSQCLEFFSSRHSSAQDTNGIDTAKYMKVPSIVTTESGTAPSVVVTKKIGLPELLHDAVVYYTAYLVALTLSQNDAAAHLQATTLRLLEIDLPT